MKLKEMRFHLFLKMIKDSAAWIELGRSFHQERTVHVKVCESFIIGKMQNTSISVKCTFMQYFKLLTHFYPLFYQTFNQLMATDLK